MMMNVELSVEWELAGESKYSEKTWLNSIVSATNPSWSDLGSNPGRRGRKPARLYWRNTQHLTQAIKEVFVIHICVCCTEQHVSVHVVSDSSFSFKLRWLWDTEIVRNTCGRLSAHCPLTASSLTDQFLGAIICRGKSNLYFIVRFMIDVLVSGNNEKGKRHMHN
jgi:hypothetical protein